MQFPLLVLAIFAAAAKDVNGIKLNVNHTTLGKRQTTDAQCISTCNSFETITSRCTAQAASGGYAACICSTSSVQAIAACVNCGVIYSTSQADINAIESSVNTYLSACRTLGFPVTIPVTTQPSVSFACTIGFNSGAGAQASTTAGQQTVTVTTGATTGAVTAVANSASTVTAPNPFALPSDFSSIDPAELSLISSLLGGATGAARL